jgi:hypothetical protein
MARDFQVDLPPRQGAGWDAAVRPNEPLMQDKYNDDMLGCRTAARNALLVRASPSYRHGVRVKIRALH